MEKKSDKTLYDVTEHLIERFGPVGTKSWKEAESKAWEEYRNDVSLKEN
jgi:hypothetical protein